MKFQKLHFICLTTECQCFPTHFSVESLPPVLLPNSRCQSSCFDLGRGPQHPFAAGSLWNRFCWTAAVGLCRVPQEADGEHCRTELEWDVSSMQVTFSSTLFSHQMELASYPRTPQSEWKQLTYWWKKLMLNEEKNKGHFKNFLPLITLNRSPMVAIMTSLFVVTYRAADTEQAFKSTINKIMNSCKLGFICDYAHLCDLRVWQHIITNEITESGCLRFGV